MKSFLSEYGLAIFSIICIILLILMASPISTKISNVTQNVVNRFTEVGETYEGAMSDQVSSVTDGLQEYGISNAQESWDASWNGDGSIMAYYFEDGTLKFVYCGTRDESLEWYEDESTWIADYTAYGAPNSSTAPWASRMSPDTYQDYNVTKVIIGEGITYIGSCALKGCPVTSVKFASTVKEIGTSAFSYTKISNITIPGSILYVDNYAFLQSSLKAVTVEEGVLEIGTRAFVTSPIRKIVLPSTLEYYGSMQYSPLGNLRTIKMTVNMTEEEFSNITDTPMRDGQPVFSIGGDLDNCGLNSHYYALPIKYTDKEYKEMYIVN